MRTSVPWGLATLTLVSLVFGAYPAAPHLPTAMSSAQTAPEQQAAQKAPMSQEELQAEVTRLTATVEKLRKRVATLEKERRADLTQDRLTKAEQRTEELQKQLVDVGDRDATLHVRLDQVNDALRPENINSAVNPMGTTRPEEARDALTRRLTNEKHQIQSQRDLLSQSRSRLQASLTNADAEVERLKHRLQEELHPLE